MKGSVFVDHMRLDLPPHVLVLRPGSFVGGNRAPMDQNRANVTVAVAMNDFYETLGFTSSA